MIHSKVYLRAHKFDSTTNATHITDIYKFINENDTVCDKTSLMTMTDSGPDFCPTSVLNMICYYCLFKKLDLDMLSGFTYAPRYSAFNYIKHLWSLLGNKLSEVVFSNIASGDSKPPNQLTLLGNEIKEKKLTIGRTLLLMVFL